MLFTSCAPSDREVEIEWKRGFEPFQPPHSGAKTETWLLGLVSRCVRLQITWWQSWFAFSPAFKRTDSSWPCGFVPSARRSFQQFMLKESDCQSLRHT